MNSSFNFLRIFPRGLLALAVLSCGGGGDDNGGGGPTGSFSVLAPTTLTVQAGSSGSVTVTVTRSGGFDDAVTLTLEDAPAGVSPSFNPALVPNGSSSATLLLAVDAATTPGTYTIKLCGNASGYTERDVMIALTVTAAPTGGFALTLDPAALSIEQGQSKTTVVTVSRTTPFTGAVALQLLITPPGVTHGFEPATIPAGAATSTLTITVAADAAPGVYPMGINGVATGVDPQSVTLTVIVTARPGDFTLVAAPNALSVEQTKAGTVDLTITRLEGFGGAVSLTVEGLPASVLGSFDPPNIPAGSTTSKLTLAVAFPAAPGVYPLVIHATSAGVPERIAPVVLTVTETPGFKLQGSGVGVQQGRVGGAGVNVVRQGGFVGAVNFVLEGTLPAGATATLVSATLPPGETTNAVTFSVMATTPVGNTTVTLHGSAPGVPDVLLPLILEVRPAPAGNVAFTFCNTTASPVWMGYQNGDEQWTQVAGQAAGGTVTYNFPITAPKGGVAWVTAWTDEPGYYIGMFLGTQAELVELGAMWCGQTPARKSHTGSVANVGSDWFTVSIGDASTEVHGGAVTYQLDGVPLGLFDLFASKTTIPVGATTSTVILRRGIDYPAGAVIPLLDFASGEKIVTTTKNVMVENYGTEAVKFSAAYVTAGGTVGQFAHRDPKVFPTPYMVIPPGSALPGDLYSLKVESSLVQDGTVNRMVVTSFTTPDDKTLTFGPALNQPAVFELQAAPLYQVRVQSTWQAEYGNVFNGKYFQDTRDGEFYVTRGFLGGGGAIDVTTPDLRFVPGWNTTWGPVSGALTVIRGTGYGWTGTTGALLPGFMGEFLTTPNVTVRTASLAKTTTP